MKLSTEDRSYEDGEISLLLRIVQPSKPHGGWPGNKETIRIWQIRNKGEVVYRRVTNEKALELERMLGEIDVDAAAFREHPTLGTVLSGEFKRLPSVWGLSQPRQRMARAFWFIPRLGRAKKRLLQSGIKTSTQKNPDHFLGATMIQAKLQEAVPSHQRIGCLYLNRQKENES